MQNPNKTIFFRQINSSKVIQLQVIFSLYNTEETQILIFPMFSMYFDVLKFKKERILECRLG